MIMKIPRQLAFDVIGRCVAAGVACQVALHTTTEIVKLPTDHYDFIGFIDPVGMTLDEICTKIDEFSS